MKKEQRVRTEICLRLNISRSIILTSLDLSGMFCNRIPRTYNSISWGYFQILFRASTKNFLSSTFKKFKSSTSKAKAHWKDFQPLLYANIGKNLHCKSFLWVWFFSQKSGTVILSQVQVQFFGSAANSRLIIVVSRCLEHTHFFPTVWTLKWFSGFLHLILYSFKWLWSSQLKARGFSFIPMLSTALQ